MAVSKAKSAAPDARLAAIISPVGGKWASEARKSALTRLHDMGLPTRRDEYWKFTRPDELTKADATPATLLETDEKPVFCDIDRLRLVFVDGVFDPDISDQMAMEHVEIEPLANAVARIQAASGGDITALKRL